MKVTLEDAVNDLYRITVIEGKKTATNRLGRLGDLCVQELEAREIAGARKEVPVPGIGREKRWDVAWTYDGKVRLAISLKSMLSNISGSVPNRADDLMGEMANVQLRSPEIVTGYIMVFGGQTNNTQSGATSWVEVFRQAIQRLSGRQAPAWAPGMVEASAIVEVDFSEEPRLVGGNNLDDFFDQLARCVKERNPGAFTSD